jgi:SAM-dependent methyltransferase
MREEEYATLHELGLVHWWFRGRRELLRRLLTRHLRQPASGRARILDFGCGAGANTEMCAALGDVVGIEPDPIALRYAMLRRQGDPASWPLYCRAEGTRLPFEGESFDAVVASDVLEHIECDGDAAAEIRRVLRPGGILVFTVPAHPWLWSPHDEALWHKRRYRREGLLAMLRGAGLTVRWHSYWNTVLFPAAVLHRMLARRRANGVPRSDAWVPPGPVNRLLSGLVTLEASALDPRRSPVGVSLVGWAERAY